MIDVIGIKDGLEAEDMLSGQTEASSTSMPSLKQPKGKDRCFKFLTTK